MIVVVRAPKLGAGMFVHGRNMVKVRVHLSRMIMSRSRMNVLERRDVECLEQRKADSSRGSTTHS